MEEDAVCVYIYIYIHTGILLSHTKEWSDATCSNMGGPRDYHAKWSKSKEDKYHMISFLC